MSDTKFSTLQELFADEARWTTGYPYRTASGRCATLNDADCWCLYGGAALVYGPHMGPVVRKLTRVIRRTHPRRMSDTEGLGKFNDHPSTTIEDIRRVVAEAGV